VSVAPRAAHGRTGGPSGVVGAAVIAAGSAAALVAANVPTADAPAHLYRTLLVRDGFGLWDNLWYGGHYPLASYSLLYYLPASIVGNRPLVLAAAVVSAALFASVVHKEWPAVGPWPARAFAVLAAGPLFTGTYSYALGVAALLGSVRALQARRTWVAAACAALTLGFSPLAFVLLCLVLTATFLTRRRLERRTLLMAGALAALCGVELAALSLFPYDGVYPFHGWALVAALAVGALGIAVSTRSRRAAPLAAFFVLWAAASVVAYLVHSPLGSNLVRIQLLIFPLLMLAALLADMRPRLLVAAALAAGLAYNVVPYVQMAAQRTTSVYAQKRSWQPALAFLRAHDGPDFRVEVVPTIEHWEAYYVPAAGFALARGWYRQLDLAQNPLLYQKTIAPQAYRSWLRGLGIRYVLLPATGIDALGAPAEQRLLQSGESGLRPVYADPLWTIYELPHATPILSPRRRARLTLFGHSRIAGVVSRAGSYTLRVRFMRYWHVSAGSLCLAPADHGAATTLVVREPGRFELTSEEQPGQLLENVVTPNTSSCPAADK
jgi:hypothetical protein